MNKIITGLLAAILLVLGFIALKPTPKVAAPTFGAAADVTTNWTAGAFSSDLLVGGALAITGTSTFSGNVSGNVGGVATTAMSSSATTTACSILNNTGSRRTVIAASILDTGSASSLGTIAVTAGTSSYPGVTPTGTKVINATITRSATVTVPTTTSTAQTAYSTWGSGEYFLFQTGTTTNSGTCNVLYY